MLGNPPARCWPIALLWPGIIPLTADTIATANPSSPSHPAPPRKRKCSKQAIYEKAFGEPLQKVLFGKPHKVTFDYAQATLFAAAEENGQTIDTIYSA